MVPGMNPRNIRVFGLVLVLVLVLILVPGTGFVLVIYSRTIEIQNEIKWHISWCGL